MARNGGTLKKSGWHVRHEARRVGAFVSEAAQSTQWDRLLRELNITEEFALSVVQGKAQGPRIRLRNWVKLQRRNLFVPERVLDALGFPIHEGEACGGLEIYSTSRLARDRGALPQAK